MISNDSSQMKNDHHSSSKSSRGRFNNRSSNNHRSQMSSVGQQFDDKRVPILYWNQNISKNNFSIWKEKLTYASMNYQFITHVLENDREFPIPDLNLPIPKPLKLLNLQPPCQHARKQLVLQKTQSLK